MAKHIGYAVVGTGPVVERAVLPAFARAADDSARLAAIVSTDRTRAQALAQAHGVPAYHLDDFRQCLQRDDVHAVYIVLPNSMHCDYAVEAARAGAHVLVERPMAVMADECRRMLTTAVRLGTPAAVRYPRGAAAGEAKAGLEELPVGKGELRRSGKRVAILAFGAMLKPALEAAEALGATVANMRFVKPLDAALVRELAEGHELIVTVEEHQVMGGAGSAVCEALQGMGIERRVLLLGLPDRFIDHGDPGKLLSSVGLDAQGIQKAIRNVISE